jgi:hypothetical protein
VAWERTADVSQIACTYLRGTVIATIGHHLQPGFAHRVLRRHCHFAELPVIVSEASRLVRDDQMMLCVDGVRYSPLSRSLVRLLPWTVRRDPSWTYVCRVASSTAS